MDSQMQQIFIDESREKFELIESALLALRKSLDPELLEDAVIAFHCVKGGCGFFDSGSTRFYRWFHRRVRNLPVLAQLSPFCSTSIASSHSFANRMKSSIEYSNRVAR